MGVSISYGVTCKDELEELQKLLLQITSHIREEDELIIQLDTTASQEVKDLLFKLGIPYIEFPLNKDFATFKNNLKKHCTKDFIIFIDADERLSEDLLRDLPEILELNPEIDLYGLCRENKVEGLTEQHISQWHWRVDEQNRVNWPDFQWRISKNSPNIQWVGCVHECLKGALYEITLPDEYCIIHHKDIKKQEQQNNLYNTI
jgi:glycosyltransferase involved in cell wall biosynthesis